VAILRLGGYSTRSLLCSIVIAAGGFITGNSCLIGIALANDRGPAGADAQIRHDLPLLLAASLGSHRSNLVVDWVVIDKEGAVAAWHASGNRGVTVLRLREGRWWWRAAAVTTPDSSGSWTQMQAPGDGLSPCFANNPGPPSVYDLVEQGFINETLAADLSGQLKAASSKSFVYHECFPDVRYVRDVGVSYDAVLYDMESLPARPVLRGHIPERWHKPDVAGAKAYYVFDLSVATAEPLMFRTDSTSLTIWFPYVLPTNARYTQ
jgi:hypothetical protein